MYLVLVNTLKSINVVLLVLWYKEKNTRLIFLTQNYDQHTVIIV